MNCTMPGLPVFHHLEFPQVYVYCISDVIQSSPPLSASSPSAFDLSQHQDLFQCQLFSSGGQSIGTSASVLSVNIQGWFPLGLTGVISLQFKGLLTLPISQFKSINSSVLCLLYGSALISVHDYWKDHSFSYMDFCQQSDLCFLIDSLGLS